MYDALGLKEARVVQAYYSHQEAKWDPKRWSIVDFYKIGRASCRERVFALV